MRKPQTFIIRVLFILCLAFFPSIMAGQELQVKEPLHVSAFDIITSDMAVNDYNDVPCALVKVQLPIPGATFQGNIFKSEFKTNEYWLWMTNGTKKFRIRCPGFQTMEVDVTKTVPEGLKSNICYAIMLTAPANGGTTNADDGMRYLVMHVKPENATVIIDDKLRSVRGGTVSVLLPMGTHSYSVEAEGYSPQSGTVEMAEGKKTMDVTLESALAQITVSCPTEGARIYVNESMVGNAPWSGQLTDGNYQIEARHDGYRPQRQSVTLAQRENRNIDLPALVAITGNLNVDYQPADAEVWIDGQKAGTSPDVFRNILVGNHSVEIRARGYMTTQMTAAIREGETTQISGELAVVSSVSSSMSVPEAVDLGLSVKWASFNLGASKPEEYGDYYAWETTKPKVEFDEANLPKYPRGATLMPEDDAATVNLGSPWRMPTQAEMEELIKKCKRKTIKDNGIVIGVKVTGPNGNSIFFPTESSTIPDIKFFGYYWTATAGNDTESIYFGIYPRLWNVYYAPRTHKFLIRPVLAE